MKRKSAANGKGKAKVEDAMNKKQRSVIVMAIDMEQECLHSCPGHANCVVLVKLLSFSMFPFFLPTK